MGRVFRRNSLNCMHLLCIMAVLMTCPATRRCSSTGHDLHSFAAPVLRNSILAVRPPTGVRVTQKYRRESRNHALLRTLTVADAESIVSRAL